MAWKTNRPKLNLNSLIEKEAGEEGFASDEDEEMTPHERFAAYPWDERSGGPMRFWIGSTKTNRRVRMRQSRITT